MKPGLPVSAVLHAGLLAWALVTFTATPPLEAPASDPIEVELLPPTEKSQPKLGQKTAKPAEQITPKDTKASTKEAEGKRVGTSAVEEPPPSPPEQKPTPPAENKPTQVATLPPEPPKKLPEPKPEPPKLEPPKPVAKVEPPPPTPPKPPAPQVKPDLPKEAEKAKDIGEGKPPEVKEPPKDQKALDKLIETKTKDEPKKEPDKKPEAKPAEKPAPKADPTKTASLSPSATKPSTTPSTTPGQASDIKNRVQTGTASARTDQQASLGTPTGPSVTSKLSQSQLEALNGQLRSQINACWTPPIGAAEANIKVTLFIELNPDGSVKVRPQVLQGPANPLGPALASSAQRAVMQCAPYKLPAYKYAAWGSNKITFDPKVP